MIWIREFPGWYISEAGGICAEQGGWYCYTRKDQDIGYGPFKTLKAAKEWFDKKTLPLTRV